MAEGLVQAVPSAFSDHSSFVGPASVIPPKTRTLASPVGVAKTAE
jgi:hypothetical protein